MNACTSIHTHINGHTHTHMWTHVYTTHKIGTKMLIWGLRVWNIGDFSNFPLILYFYNFSTIEIYFYLKLKIVFSNAQMIGHIGNPRCVWSSNSHYLHRAHPHGRSPGPQSLRNCWPLHRRGSFRRGRTTLWARTLLRAQAGGQWWDLPPEKANFALFFPASPLFQGAQVGWKSLHPLDFQEIVIALSVPTSRDGGRKVEKQGGKDRFDASNVQWFSFVISGTLNDSPCSRFRCPLSKATIFVKADSEKGASWLVPSPSPSSHLCQAAWGFNCQTPGSTAFKRLHRPLHKPKREYNKQTRDWKLLCCHSN